MVLGLCRRFGALPSQVLAEDVTLLRMLEIERLGTREEVQGDGSE